MSKEQRQNGGRAFKPIDWNIVDNALVAGCSGVEIAGLLGVHYETLYDRTVKEKGKSFTEYSHEKKAKGDSLLRQKQFQEAMKGDRGMLIWLGKNRLGQRENSAITIENPKAALEEIMNRSEKPVKE